MTAGPPTTWRLSLGDSWRFRLDQTFVPMESPEPEDAQQFVFEGSVKVTGIKTGGFDFERTSRLTRQMLGTDLLPPIPNAPNRVEPLRFATTGIGVDEPDRYADEAEFRLSRLLWFAFPKVGADTFWTATFPEIRPGWGPEVVGEYRRAGKTECLNRTCIRYNVRYTERRQLEPMSASGHIDVDEVTGLLMAASIEAKNAPIPGGELVQRLTVKYEVSDLKLEPGKPGYSGSR